MGVKYSLICKKKPGAGNSPGSIFLSKSEAKDGPPAAAIFLVGSHISSCIRVLPRVVYTCRTHIEGYNTSTSMAEQIKLVAVLAQWNTTSLALHKAILLLAYDTDQTYPPFRSSVPHTDLSRRPGRCRCRCCPGGCPHPFSSQCDWQNRCGRPGVKTAKTAATPCPGR